MARCEYFDMAADVDVLIVGAGPTGLLLSAELHRRGIECRVIDAHPAPLHWDRATVVHPRSLEVFESLGIVEPLLEKGVKQRTAQVYSAGSLLGAIDLALCGSRYPFNIGISEEVTESILNEYLERLGGKVLRGAKLVKLEQKEDGLTGTIGHDGKSEQVAARWVVGCDGVHSITRQLGGMELIGHDLEEPWAVFDTTVPGWADSYEANYAYLDETPVILTALPQRRWRVYLRPSAAESDLEADALGTLQRYLPKLTFADVTNPTRFHCHTKIATKYRSGRILVAGDAAHVCSPSQGHGMNSGIQDAFNLAWKLALVCQGHAGEAILDSYEAERRPVAAMITKSGDEFEQAQDITDPAERRKRDAAMRGAFADPKSRHHESIAEAELDIDYCDSPIVMGDQHEAISPGERLPDTIEVQLAEGGTKFLHTLAHREGHTAMVFGGAAARGEELPQLEKHLRERKAAPVVEETVGIIAVDGEHQCARIAQHEAERLGVGEITLLVVRPDGHVGLRADRNHAAALAKYEALLASGKR